MKTVWRSFRLPVSAFATLALKSFNGKFTVIVDFLLGHFMSPLLTLIGSLKSLHKLVDKYLNQMLVKFEQNHTVGSMQIFLAFWQKMVYHF